MKGDKIESKDIPLIFSKEISEREFFMRKSFDKKQVYTYIQK